jgi:hypothetical protein
MRKRLLWIAALAALLSPGQESGWQSEFPAEKRNLAASGENSYFPLTPGLRLHYAEGKNTLVRSVLAETKMVDGVETRVVEDRESSGGRLVEVARDYYAVDGTTGDVYYFGEDVDNYKNGKVDNHEGSWLSGVRGARFGLMMPGKPERGRKFYQEQAPGVGMDRAEVVSLDETVTAPAGTFRGCVRMKETSALEKGTEWKWYARGVGMVKEGEFVLVRIEKGP